MKTKLATITVFLAGLFLATFAQAQGSLEGAWQAQEIMISGGNNAGTFDTLGLIVFSEGHYSAFSNIGDRPDVPDGPGPLENDEQRVASFLAIRANAGTYEVSGSKLMLHFILARNPRVVGNDTESEYSIDGDTLTITGTNAQDVVTRTTYARVD
jgi:hypothetical protein